MFFRIALLAVVPALAVAQDPAIEKPRPWGPRSGRLQLSIASDRARYEVGETIEVTVVLKNVSEYSTELKRMKGVPTYSMEVLAPGASWLGWRQKSALTPLGEETMDLRRATGTVGVDLAPGRESSEKYEINRLFEMSAPGEYSVTLQCRQPTTGIAEGGKEHPMVEVTSNTITIAVLPKQQ